MMYASLWAGDLSLGASSSSCTPSKICLMVIEGRHCSSSLRMLRQTVPEG